MLWYNNYIYINRYAYTCINIYIYVIYIQYNIYIYICTYIYCTFNNIIYNNKYIIYNSM